MSGKAPPTGPRALLGSTPKVGANSNNAASHNHHNNNNNSNLNVNNRIGTAPPTGPRSLTQNGGSSSSNNSNNNANNAGRLGNAASARARTQSTGVSGGELATRLNGQQQYNDNQNTNGVSNRRNSTASSLPNKMWETESSSPAAPSTSSSSAPSPPVQPKMKFKFLGPIRNQPPQPTSEPPPPPPPSGVPPPLPPPAHMHAPPPQVAKKPNAPPPQKIKFSLNQRPSTNTNNNNANIPPPLPPASPPPLPPNASPLPPNTSNPRSRFSSSNNNPAPVVSGGVSLSSTTNTPRGLSGGVGLGIPRGQTQSPFQQQQQKQPSIPTSSSSSTPLQGSRMNPMLVQPTTAPSPPTVAPPKKPAAVVEKPPAQPEKPKVYSLPPLPPWPPSQDSYPSGLKTFKVLYDPAIPPSTALIGIGESSTHYKKVIEIVKKVLPAEKAQERVRGWVPDNVKGKGKEILVRIEGEVVQGEGEIVVKDPRSRDDKASFPGVITSKRKPRTEFLETKYEYDANTPGPEPPRSVLLLHISPLTPSAGIRRHLASHGNVQSVEPQIDRENGAPLGIVFARFSTHEEAVRCVTKEDGSKSSLFGGMNASVSGMQDGDVRLRAVLDGQGLLLKAVLKEIDERRKSKKEKDKDANKEKSIAAKTQTPASAMTPASVPPTAPSASRPPPIAPANMNGRHGIPTNPSTMKTVLPNRVIPQQPNGKSSPVSALPFSTASTSTLLTPDVNDMNKKLGLPANPMTARVRRPLPSSGPGMSSSRPGRAMPMNSSRYAATVRDEDRHWDPAQSSRDWSSRRDNIKSSRSQSRERERRPRYASSSYVPAHDRYRSRSPRDRRRVAVIPANDAETKRKNKELHLELVKELARNGKDHVSIDGGGAQLLGGIVQEEDVIDFFKGFRIDKVLKDHIGWYVTFQTADTARRAAMVLNSGERKLAYRSVQISVHPAPAMPVSAATPKVDWTDEELVDQAGKLILKELGTLLEKDIKDRVVATRLRGVINGVVRKKDPLKAAAGESMSVGGKAGEDAEKKGLKGLSFKRRKKDVPAAAVVVQESEPEPEPEPEQVQVQLEVEEESEGEPIVVLQPKKRRKKEPIRKKVKQVVQVESEDEQPTPTLKRPVSSEPEDDEDEEQQPLRKKLKVDSSTKTKKQKQKTTPEPPIQVVAPDSLDYDVPEVVPVRCSPTPGFESSLSPSRSPSPLSPGPPSPKRRLPTPPPEPPEEEVCADDEDLYFTRLALSGTDPSIADQPALLQDQISAVDQFEVGLEAPPPQPSAAPFRVHVTGSARTEGYYKITHAEKMAYVTQYQARASLAASKDDSEPQAEPEKKPQHVTSSRSNRADARRRAQGMEEINQVQHAIALSIGAVSSANDLSSKFNQLQTRKKHLRFARSPIHDWGLYALEKISKGEMVIEYVGEVIRAQVADKREKAYERQGIGSSYLFRIDEDLVVDATKKGNLGRLINHSCDPNCTAKIITINGEKKIVIYAKIDIELGDEITYDYHFPIEQDKIRCLCGSEKCRGFLN